MTRPERLPLACSSILLVQITVFCVAACLMGADSNPASKPAASTSSSSTPCSMTVNERKDLFDRLMGAGAKDVNIQVGDEGVELLITFPDDERVAKCASVLKGVELPWIELSSATDAGLQALALNTSPKHLVATGEYTGEGLRALQSMGQLTYLDLRGRQAPADEAMAQLAAMPALETLELDCPGVKAKGLKALLACKKLESLSLGCHMRLGKAEVAAVAECTRLHQLYFRNSFMDLHSTDSLGALTELESLMLATKCDKQDLAFLAKLPKLKSLWVSVEGPGTVEALAKATSLKQLEIWGSLAGNTLDALVPLGLEKLVLRGRDVIDDSSIPALKRMTSLKVLNLTGTGVTKEGLSSLREALPNTAIRPAK